MAGSSARNRAEKMMAYRMASRSTKKETYTSQVPREFGCGIRRLFTSARSSSQNNLRISAGEMLTIARCISPRPLRCIACAPRPRVSCHTCTTDLLATRTTMNFIHLMRNASRSLLICLICVLPLFMFSPLYSHPLHVDTTHPVNSICDTEALCAGTDRPHTHAPAPLFTEPP